MQFCLPNYNFLLNFIYSTPYYRRKEISPISKWNDSKTVPFDYNRIKYIFRKKQYFMLHRLAQVYLYYLTVKVKNQITEQFPFLLCTYYKRKRKNTLNYVPENIEI